MKLCHLVCLIIFTSSASSFADEFYSPEDKTIFDISKKQQSVDAALGLLGKLEQLAEYDSESLKLLGSNLSDEEYKLLLSKLVRGIKTDKASTKDKTSNKDSVDEFLSSIMSSNVVKVSEDSKTHPSPPTPAAETPATLNKEQKKADCGPVLLYAQKAPSPDHLDFAVFRCGKSVYKVNANSSVNVGSSKIKLKGVSQVEGNQLQASIVFRSKNLSLLTNP